MLPIGVIDTARIAMICLLNPYESADGLCGETNKSTMMKLTGLWILSSFINNSCLGLT